MVKPRILLADDNEELLSLFKELLEPDFEVVATVRNGHELVNAFKIFKPDVSIVDINMPEMSGVDATRKIMEEDLDARVILLSAHHDRTIIEEGFSAGAKGFVLKLTADDDLVHAVNEINRGNTYISPYI